MKHSEFTGEVQHRIEAATQGEAIRSIRAVLTTLGERIQDDEAKDLASPLPMEIDYYLLQVDVTERFSYTEFVERVAERANVDESEAAYQAQAIMALLHELEPIGEEQDIRESLPDDYEDLFELVGVENPPWAEGETRGR